MEIEPPVRERQVLPRCRCMVINTANESEWDECPYVVSSPDSPLCNFCEVDHPQGYVGDGFRIGMRGVEG
jgi:hypothetical protein